MTEKRDIICATVSGIALIASLAGWFKDVLPFDIAWVAIVLCGIPILIGSATALVKDHDIKADVLVSMALIASICIQEYFAAGEVAFIMALGTLLEDGTARKAHKGIEDLVKLTPQTARIIRDGHEQTVAIEDVGVGDTVVVLAGQTVPVDGVITSGHTSIDTSTMTGEPLPQDKAEGDEVISGTVNQMGTFQMEATKTGEDSSLQRMVVLARQADEQKAPIVHAADRWATWLVVVAFSCAVIVGLATASLLRAVTVLVVFCPCAFILATPTAVLAGIANASHHGILVRSGDALERFAHVTHIAFDKTGTLTSGKPRVNDIIAFSGDEKDAAEAIDGEKDAAGTAGFGRNEVAALAASAEMRSEHPLGKAVCAWCDDRDIAYAAPSDSEVLAGMGMRAQVHEGDEGTPGDGQQSTQTTDFHDVLVGTPALLERYGIRLTAEAEKVRARFLTEGATTALVSVDGILAGMIVLSDEVRPDAETTVKRLSADGIDTLLLTGDNACAAHHVAERVGIATVRAGLLPEDKMAAIGDYDDTRSADGENQHVCMVGDGVNDSLALRSAYASIAMGGIGSDIAVESAGAVLVSDAIERVPYLLELSRKTMRRINGNIAFSMTWNIAAVTLAALGILDPVWGAIWHNAGSVAVVVSSALLLTARDADGVD